MYGTFSRERYIDAFTSNFFVKRRFHRFQEAADGVLEEGKFARLHFGHAETLVPVACLFDITADRDKTLYDHLRPYPDASLALESSFWLKSFLNTSISRYAQLSPMGCNLIITYDVSSSHVRLYWNEELLSGAWCDGSFECSLDVFVDRVGLLSHRCGNCDRSSHCKVTCQQSTM